MGRAWFKATYKDHHLAQVNTLAKNIMFHFHGNDLLWPLLSATLGNMKSLDGLAAACICCYHSNGLLPQTLMPILIQILMILRTDKSNA